jgi:hypothetical protein
VGEPGAKIVVAAQGDIVFDSGALSNFFDNNSAGRTQITGGNITAGTFDWNVSTQHWEQQ